ncbi:MAG: FAD:protein FMN transferase [Brevinemataceae bacterium]
MKKICVLLGMLFLISCSGGKLIKREFFHDAMYTSFSAIVYSSLPEKSVEKQVYLVWEKIDYFDRELSAIGEGFIGTLNRTGQIRRSVNPEIFDLTTHFITLSRLFNENSQGAFDLTVYPLVRLWGFYLQDQHKIPTNDEIKNVLKSVGMDKIKLSEDSIKLCSGVKLDLGAIAKGFAVDEAVKMLSSVEGIESGIVNAGGNLRVFGEKPGNQPWTIGIRNPNHPSKMEDTIYLYDGDAIATSGDYERYFEVDGVYYHHIFNPNTGRPVDHNLSSVSVITKGSAELADITATTILSLGSDKYQEFLQKMNLQDNMAVFLIQRNKKKLTSSANSLWKDRKSEEHSNLK